MGCATGRTRARAGVQTGAGCEDRGRCSRPDRGGACWLHRQLSTASREKGRWECQKNEFQTLSKPSMFLPLLVVRFIRS